MADIKQIKVGATTYNIKDETARGQLVPTDGTTGQVLKKTANGYVWANGSGGTQLYKHTISLNVETDTSTRIVLYNKQSTIYNFLDGQLTIVAAEGIGTVTLTQWDLMIGFLIVIQPEIVQYKDFSGTTQIIHITTITDVVTPM